MAGYDPNEPRDSAGRWTDGGDAIKSAASDGKPPIEIAYATYRVKPVSNDKQDEEIRNSPEYKLQQEAISEAAAGLGIEIAKKDDTWGGYVDSENGIHTNEVSNVIRVNTTPEKADLLAAVIGKTAPEVQDSVLVGHYNPNGDAYQYTISTGSFDKAKQAVSSLKDNGIQYYTLNKSNGDIILIDTDNSIAKNVVNFVTNLKDRGLYENSEYTRADAKFVGSQQYDSIIEKGRDQTRSENGFDIDAFIKKTEASYTAAAKRKVVMQTASLSR